MALMIIKAKDCCGKLLPLAYEYMRKAHRQGRYLEINEADVLDSYYKARDQNLRYNRKTNILRDNRLGILSEPSNRSEWSIATVDEAIDAISHEIWCNAVSTYNRKGK